MPLNPKGFAYAMAALCGLGALFVGLLNMVSPSYGVSLLVILASIYPGYHLTSTIGSVVVLTGYAMMDGAVKGWVLAWLYNRALKTTSS